MILDFHPNTGAFTLRVPRNEADVRVLMREHGLDFSAPASTQGEAVLFTREPYAACAFAEFAAPEARARLLPLLNEIDASWKKTSNLRIKVPADQELWPFQKANLEYALRRRNTLVGDQPGLGKTPVAIAMANEIGARRVLVVCPANIRLQWAKMIRVWSTMQWPYVVYPILNSRNGVHPTAAWTIISYDLIRDPVIAKMLVRGHYDLLVVDEAHYIKNSETGRTRAIFGRQDTGDATEGLPALASCSERILALTGTPLPNRPREAYTLARGLCFDAIDWCSEETFKTRFNPSAKIDGVRADGSRYTYVREEAGRHGELQARLRANFMVRHMKRDVMDQLKLPVYDIVLVDETAAVKQALAAESLLHIDPEDADLFQNADGEVLGHIAAVRHMMGVAKAPLVADYAAMALDGGEDKLVIFAWHIAVLDILQERLRKFGVVRVDGSTSPAKRQRAVDDFITKPELQVFLGNIQSIGIGVDGLQKVCSHALFAEPSWVPGENQQAVDRLDRGGQARTVQADFLVAPGSLDERILSSSLKKLHQVDKVLDRRVK